MNPGLSLLPLIEAPDASLELRVEAGMCDAGFDSVAPLAVFGVTLLTAARVSAGIVSFAAVPVTAVFAAGLAADFTLFFTVALLGLAIGFVAAVEVFGLGLGVVAAVVACLRAAVFSKGFLADAVSVLLFDVAVFAASLTLLAAVPFVADLVTVALMFSSEKEPLDLFASCLKNVTPAVSVRFESYRAPLATFFHAYCQTTTSAA